MGKRIGGQQSEGALLGVLGVVENRIVVMVV